MVGARDRAGRDPAGAVRRGDRRERPHGLVRLRGDGRLRDAEGAAAGVPAAQPVRQPDPPHLLRPAGRRDALHRARPPERRAPHGHRVGRQELRRGDGLPGHPAAAAGGRWRCWPGRAAGRWCWRSSGWCRCCWRSGRRSTRCCSTASRASTSFTRRSAGSTRSACAWRCWRGLGATARWRSPSPPSPLSRARERGSAAPGSPLPRAGRGSWGAGRSPRGAGWRCGVLGLVGARRVLGLVVLGAALLAPDWALALAARAMRRWPELRDGFGSPEMLFSYQWWNLAVLAGLLTALGRWCSGSGRGGGCQIAGPLAVALLVVDLFSFGIGFNTAADTRAARLRAAEHRGDQGRSRPVPGRHVRRRRHAAVEHEHAVRAPGRARLRHDHPARVRRVPGADRAAARHPVQQGRQAVRPAVAGLAAARPAERQVRADLADDQPAELDALRPGRRHPGLPQRRRDAARLRAGRATAGREPRGGAGGDPRAGLRSAPPGRSSKGGPRRSAAPAWTRRSARSSRPRSWRTATTGSTCGRRRDRAAAAWCWRTSTSPAGPPPSMARRRRSCGPTACSGRSRSGRASTPSCSATGRSRSGSAGC